jgi:hypothetical protein
VELLLYDSCASQDIAPPFSDTFRAHDILDRERARLPCVTGSRLAVWMGLMVYDDVILEELGRVDPSQVRHVAHRLRQDLRVGADSQVLNGAVQAIYLRYHLVCLTLDLAQCVVMAAKWALDRESQIPLTAVYCMYEYVLVRRKKPQTLSSKTSLRRLSKFVWPIHRIQGSHPARPSAQARGPGGLPRRPLPSNAVAVQRPPQPSVGPRRHAAQRAKGRAACRRC